jgi:hypothetical protein
VSTHRRHYVGKDGVARVYETHLLRRSYRQDGKVKNETVANLSHDCPDSNQRRWQWQWQVMPF